MTAWSPYSSPASETTTFRRALRCGEQLDVPVVGGRGELVQMRFVAIRGRAELDARLEALY